VDHAKEHNGVDLAGRRLTVADVIPGTHADEGGHQTRHNDVREHRVPPTQSLLN